MKPITEQKVDWSILSDTLELSVRIEIKQYPVVMKLFNAENKLIMEATFEQPPILLKSNFSPGQYYYKVIKNGRSIYTDTITL